MKAIGITRRIDELGRIVIPKEIRRTCHIDCGDPIEIYLGEDGEIILQKYDPEPEITALKEAAKRMANTIPNVNERKKFVEWSERAIELISEEME